MGEIDRAYKLLFSHPRLVTDLLRGCVEGEWVERLDLEAPERLPTEQVGDRLAGRRGDLVWRLRLRRPEGGWVYLHLLFEFQSRVDRWMALRIQVYTGLLHQSLLREGTTASDGLLPPVLPIVLYNGRARWTAPTDLAELVEPVERPGSGRSGLPPPRLTYLLIDARRWIEDAAGDEEDPTNLALAVFRLEASRDVEELRREIAQLVAAVPPGAEQAPLRRALVTWLVRVAWPRRSRQRPDPDLIRDLEEVEPMLQETMREWEAEWRRESLREGLEQGLEQGQRSLLTRQLELEFGPLPDGVRRRLEEAGSEELTSWGERLLTAGTLDEVFGT